MNSQELILDIKDIKKDFGKNKVIKGVDLKISKGEKVCIIGVNGGGKTTLVKIILGLYKQSSGTVDYPYYGDIKQFLKNTGVQFQDSTLPLNYTVNEVFNLVYGLSYKPKSIKEFKNWIKNDREVKKDEFLNFFSLNDKRKTKIKNLSGGQKQRLNILLALSLNPEVLILDELTTGLDIKAKRTLLNYISDYQKNHDVTTIIVSHLIQEIDTLADRIIFYDEGVIKSDMTIKEINKKYKSLEKYLDEIFIPTKNMEVES